MRTFQCGFPVHLFSVPTGWEERREEEEEEERRARAERERERDAGNRWRNG